MAVIADLHDSDDLPPVKGPQYLFNRKVVGFKATLDVLGREISFATTKDWTQ
jgi:hypothetical protein